MSGQAPKGPNHKSLPRIKHKRSDVWECRVCHYKPNVDKMSGSCVSCGRDFWGNPGTIPKDTPTKDRQQLPQGG